jgi:hypothetical protein
MPYSIVDPLTKLQESDCNAGLKSSLLSLHASTHVQRPDGCAQDSAVTAGANHASTANPANIIAVSTATCASAFAAPVAV